MANFVIVVDRDSERRSRFIKVIEPLLPPVDGLVTATCSNGDFWAGWAAAECAPVTHVTDQNGAAVIWGEAIPRSGSKRVSARELRELWKAPATRISEVYDGFYAAVVYQPEAGIIVGADLLGLFPIYYYASGKVLLVGSSPELFRHHSAFRAEFNPAGLVGILLTGSLFDGQTLLRGVRRLAARHLLLWGNRHGTSELEQYRIHITMKYLGLPPSAHVRILDGVLDELITRHVSQGDRCGLLLSGGIDSRLLGGFLRRKGIGATAALTIGLPNDIEMRCAIPVARALGFEHRAVNVTDDQYPICADLQAKWEHGCNGFNWIMDWGLYPHLRGLPQRVVIGHVMDYILAAPICWTYSSPLVQQSFESCIAYHNSCGLRPEILTKLLRQEIFDGLVDETIANLRKVYESYAELEFHRAWCFELNHRGRFYVGGAAWVISFSSWPVVPALDQALLESVAAMPPTALWERGVQKNLLCTRFPHLAQLPFDRNSYDTAPLQPRLRWMLKDALHGYVRRRLAPFRQLFHRSDQGRKECRYYYRICDVNSPGWRAVRGQAEPYRERVHNLFNRDMLDTLLPPPDVSLQLRDGITDSSGLKSLLGFMLWSREYLR